MRSPLPFRLIAGALFSFLALIASADANHAPRGGSLSREEFLDRIVDENLRRYVAGHFDLAEDGRAARAGRHLPNAGERLPPFELVAGTHGPEDDRVVLRIDAPRARHVVVLPCAASAHYAPDCE